MQAALALLMLCSSNAFALPSESNQITQVKRDSTSASEQGPSGAVHAPHDPSKLKYEIIGIVGAYLFWLAATILLICFVGRRLRKKNIAFYARSDMTMMKTFNTNNKTVEVPVGMKSPGLKSPLKFSNMKSWGKKGHKTNPSDFSVSTVQSIESAFHQQNKAKDMDELTKLYAAVMSQDEERSQGHNSTTQSPVLAQDTSPLSPGYPPEFAHLHNVQAATQSNYGPTLNQPLHHPMAPTPTNGSFPEDEGYNYDPNYPSRNSSRTNKSTPMSIISDIGSRAGSVVSSKSKPSRISIRNHGISQPIGSADLRDAHHYDETVPLSPRVYTPGPPPPTPGNKKQPHVTIESVVEEVPIQHEYQRYQEQITQQYNYQQEISQSPHQHQQSYPMQYQQEQYQNLPPALTSPTLPSSPRAKHVPAALALRSAALNNAAASAATAHPANAPKVLPFRNMYGDAALRSAPPTKTTFLDRPDKSQSGPRTGIMPSTPYSPYMPNTPMTPITPRRLMNKQELKAKRKEEKLQALREDDLVEADDDMWGS